MTQSEFRCFSRSLAALCFALGCFGCAGAQEKATSSVEPPALEADEVTGPQATEPPCQKLSGQEAQEMVAGGATLLDVRSQEEFDEAHLDGATLIPHAEVGARSAELSSDEPIVVYCRFGKRAAIAAQTLREQGFTVYELGGIENWESTGDPCD